jgi:hypothetical protein
MPRKGKNLPTGKKLAGKGLKRIDTEKAFGKAVVGGTDTSGRWLIVSGERSG